MEKEEKTETKNLWKTETEKQTNFFCWKACLWTRNQRIERNRAYFSRKKLNLTLSTFRGIYVTLLSRFLVDPECVHAGVILLFALGHLRAVRHLSIGPAQLCPLLWRDEMSWMGSPGGQWRNPSKLAKTCLEGKFREKFESPIPIFISCFA